MLARFWVGFARLSSGPLLLGFLFTFIIGVYPSWAGITGSISGTLLGPQDIAEPQIRVQLRSAPTADQSSTSLHDSEAPFVLGSKMIEETESSATGTFEFPLLVLGDYQIFVQAPDYEPFVAPVHVSSGGNTDLPIHLIPLHATPEMLLEVKGNRQLFQNTAATSSTEVNRDQISHLPQGGEVSLPKLLATTTPGIVLGPFGQTFFRGNHANVQYQLDGIQMPDSPSNAFGQAVSPRNIDRMEVITGGIPAEYGQRLSAVINIVSRSGSENPEGEVELNYGSYNTVSPHLLFGGSTESGHIHYFFSANYNRTDRGLDTPQPVSESDQSQGGTESIHNLSYGNGEFAKMDWQVDNGNKLSFILFHSNTSYQIPNYPTNFQPQDDFFQTGFQDAFGNNRATLPTYNYVPSNTNDTQAERNAYAQVIWKHIFSERSFLQLAPYYKYSSIVVGNDPVNDLSSEQFHGVGDPRNSPGATQAGNTPINQSNPSSFAQNRHINNLGLKGDYTFRANEDHLLKAGFQFQASRSEGLISIQTDLGSAPFVDSSPNTGFFESLYVQDDYKIAQPLTLNVGMRFDATQFAFAGRYPTDFLFQPRVGLNYLLSDQTKLHAFYGKLFQPAAIESLRYEYNGTSGAFVPLQSYDILAEKDDYFEMGVAQSLFDTQVVSFNLYYKNGVNVLDDAQLLNTSIAQPYNFATGYAYGAEFSVRGQWLSHWSEFFNYSYEIAKGRGISGGIWTGVTPIAEAQFLDHVQVHTANAGITYTKNAFWWTTQGLFGSGLRTGENNSLSLPSHFSFDTSVGYQFRGNHWWSQVKVSGDLLNVLDNRYPITIANGFNGSHYAVGRQYFIRLTKEF